MILNINLTRSENINHYGSRNVKLDIEEYLYGVVPAECPTSWSLETLKAQAIAARSYAIVKHNRKGHLDDTTSNQAFIITKKSDKSNRAVNETTGQVLTYNNSVAECVFSASNGGRCVSAKAQWGGDIPYLIAKDDPWTAATGKAKNGHGVGLSQWGAYYAGSRGIGHQQILDFYYPKTVLKSNYGSGNNVGGGSTTIPGINIGKIGIVVVNSAGLNVRNSPNGDLLNYKLYNGHRITVLEESSAGGFLWFRVNDEMGRTDGWVRSDFITLDNSSGGNTGGSSGFSTWQEKYGNNTFVESNSYSGNVYRFQVDMNKWRVARSYTRISEDGLWGSGSASATLLFQQAYSDLTNDGQCGPATKAKLFDLYGR